MENLDKSVRDLRLKYREIFKKSAEELKNRINSLKPDISGDIFDKYDEDSAGCLWQKNILNMLENEISRDIYKKWQDVLAYRKMFKCAGCGSCCKLACSEFSFEQLKEKSSKGDNFATQFVSVFVPYDSKDDAKKIYPEYIKMLENFKEDDVYFYHCPKLTECDRCSDYENRPQICKDFPDNPLALLPKNCGYKIWKDETEPVALMLHAMLELVQYYKTKIEACL